MDKPDKIARHWLSELAAAKDHEKEWHERSKKIVKRYRDERTGNADAVKYNILYANTEVLRGVMYQQKPTPDIRRRYRDDDVLGRKAADILERGISYSLDDYDFDGLMSAAVLDRLLCGRGQARIRYIPHTVAMDREIEAEPMDYDGDDPIWPEGAFERDGQMFQMEQYDQVVYEEARCEYVDWEMFRISPAKRWSKVRWVAFGELLTRQDLVRQFGDKGKLVKLTWTPDGIRHGDTEDETERKSRALVWTVWNKTDKKVYVVCDGYPDAPLEVAPDPLGLEGFFPCPEPMVGCHTNDSLIPVPDYVQYQDQAEELDTLTDRINALVDALRRRGVYDATISELSAIADAEDNQFIPVQNMAGLMERGGIDNILMEMPIEGIAKVLVSLYEQREQVKQSIYEITGISDIARGATDAAETATAQQIKSQYSSVRIGPQQKSVQKFARDLIRLKAELIAEHFEPETLAAMTGVKLPTQEDVTIATMQALAQGQEPPDLGPTWDDVMGLLKNDKLRGFRIDIETDSTILPDTQADNAAMSEMLQGISTFNQSLVPIVQSGTLSTEAAKTIMLSFIRKLKLSKEVEDALEREDRGGGQQIPPEVEQQLMQMQEQLAQAQQMLEQADVAKTQLEQQKAQADVQIEQAKLQLQKQAEAAEIQIKQAEQAGKSQVEIAKIQASQEAERLKAETQLQVADMNRQKELEIARLKIQADADKADRGAARSEVQSEAGASREKADSEAVSGVLGAVVKSITSGRRVVRDENEKIIGVEPIDG